METGQIRGTLEQLIGHLVIDTDRDNKNLDRLNQLLVKTSFKTDPCAPKPKMLSFEKSDLFFEDKIPQKTLKSLAFISESREAAREELQFRVFKRAVPVRNHLIYGSVPGWAVGATAETTVGPFLQPDGRNFWFDFFLIEKFSELYIQGINTPVLLFKGPESQIFEADGNITLPGRITKTFKLLKGSLWVASGFLAAGTPAGTYSGLTVSGGSIVLGNVPKVVNGKLTVPANTTITVNAELQQQEALNANPDSLFGIDARTMEIELPKTFKFHFSTQDKRIDNISESHWKLYGDAMEFTWEESGQPVYQSMMSQISIPLKTSSQQLQILETNSPVNKVARTGDIQNAAWLLPVAPIDLTQPGVAAGTGALWVRAGEGIHTKWQGMKHAGLSLKNPSFIGSPGVILLADTATGNPHATQSFDLWIDESNPFGNSVTLRFNDAKPFFYISNADGNELLMYAANTEFKIDRPVKADGTPPEIRSLNSLFLLAVNDTGRLLYLFDDNIIVDEATFANTDPFAVRQFALALENALFKVSGVNGCLLFGSLSEDYMAIQNGFLFLTFGLYRYIPILPDPYAANLGILRRQVRDGFRGSATKTAGPSTGQGITAWLVCRVKWDQPEGETAFNLVRVSFHFAPLNNQFGGISLEDIQEEEPAGNTNETPAPSEGSGGFLAINNPIGNVQYSPVSGVGNGSGLTESGSTAPAVFTGNAVNASSSAAVADHENRKPLPDFEEIWDGLTSRYRYDWFSLLDVSSRADLFGISFNFFQRQEGFMSSHSAVAQPGDLFPLQVEGMKVVSRGMNVKTFTVPQISWEPLINLTDSNFSGDPPPGYNYYPHDGGPMHILNSGQDTVALAPIPLTDYLLKNFRDTKDFKAMSFMTLPFGIRALTFLENKHKVTLEDGTIDIREGSKFDIGSQEFDNGLTAGRQIRLDAGEAFIKGESNMFVGSTVQINNVLDFKGDPTGNSTLGRTVTDIFNNEFMPTPSELLHQRGVPLTRIDLSGYGATSFSNWLNPAASFAKTSQARFDVVVGRCAHEIIQVVSMIYPWGVKVVRTITMYRVGSGYVYRHDSGWRADSDGRFDFRYFVNVDPDTKVEKESPYEIHPGIVKGLFNVQNIIETDAIKVEEGQMVSAKYVDSKGLYVTNPAPGSMLDFKLQPVYFDADIEVENVTSGYVEKTIHNEQKKVVPSKKIVGYVQSAPQGIPITKEILRNVVIIQLGSIGGPIDCEVNLALSDQKMRLIRFDFNNSLGANGSDIVFAASGAGSVLLPKDGSWTMVKHERSNGDVSPVPPDLSIPVIRNGKVVKDGLGVKIDTDPSAALLRIADPTDLLRQPATTTVNYGFLQNTDTQKALFLAPSYIKDSKKLNSKIPPLFVDAFRIVNSKGIFPNIGDATTNFGKAIPLMAGGVNPFPKGALKDLGVEVRQLMDITDTIGGVKQQGYQLIKQGINKFDLPNKEFNLIDLGPGNFRIYIEYKGKNQGGSETKGDLDFNINSLAQGAEETWKSKMENVGIVVDLAGIDRLMRISGSWDSKKGQEASYPGPKLEFSPVLQPVIDILEILQKLQGEDYAGAVASGLKLAMSNKAGSWEYKFEASKEIPVLRFPVPDFLYNDPNAPFKLEAGLKLSAYFNAALQVTTKSNELLPSAGGSLGFYGRLSVMCVSLSVATIYAIGQVNLDIGADTKVGPSMHLKFGFGAQLVIGLPVAGNVSVLYMVGVEIFAAEGDLEISAFILFEGHAEILGGLVSITIRIEAKGTISRKALPGGDSRADLAAQVTFGIDISIAFVINISFTKSWQEQRQIA